MTAAIAKNRPDLPPAATRRAAYVSRRRQAQHRPRTPRRAGDTKPERRTNRPPPYPDLLRQQGIEAEVVVVVNISTQAEVSGVTLAKGSTYPEFNEASKAAALAEEFTPATKNGEAVPYSLKYAHFFRLTET